MSGTGSLSLMGDGVEGYQGGPKARPRTTGVGVRTPKRSSTLSKMERPATQHGGKGNAMGSRQNSTRLSPPKGSSFRLQHGNTRAKMLEENSDPNVMLMQKKLKDLESENQLLKDERHKRQTSYIRREQTLQNEITELKDQAAKLVSKEPPAKTTPLDGLRRLHGEIQENLMHMQDRTRKLLGDQQRQLAIRFRSQLREVEGELESERGKNPEEEMTGVMDKLKKEQDELEWTREEALKLSRQVEDLEGRITDLNRQVASSVDDKERAVKMLVRQRRENSRLLKDNEMLKEQRDKYSMDKDRIEAKVEERLQADLAEVRDELNRVHEESELLREENGRLMFEMENQPAKTKGGRPRTSAGVTRGGIGSGASPFTASPTTGGPYSRYQSQVQRMQKLLKVERGNLKTVRKAYIDLLSSRTELEAFLRQSIDDVRNEMQQQKQRFNRVPLSTISPQERERILELLLSKERVVSLLYDKTFPEGLGRDPIHSIFSGVEKEAGTAGAGAAGPEVGEGDAPDAESYGATRDHLTLKELDAAPPRSPYHIPGEGLVEGDAGQLTVSHGGDSELWDKEFGDVDEVDSDRRVLRTRTGGERSRLAPRGNGAQTADASMGHDWRSRQPSNSQRAILDASKNWASPVK